ncbi:MAG TPA: tetratricopeptide repeat protein [Albitalea sp.]|uniref:tetratricopeptide repeat protein n=1 Tax=Piscinibacter sp. TaxID=1903157 RepID=UPI002ED4A378
MSLINQVLRDLDRRHAQPVVPGAVKALHEAAPRARRGRVLALGIAAIGIVGVAGGMAAWSVGARALPVPVVAAVAVPVPERHSTPVIVVTAPPAASAPVQATTAMVTRPAIAAPLAEIVPPAAPAVPVPAAEPRIEKRAPSRTAHERAEAELQKGIAAHQQGQLADAATAYAAALREEPGHAGAREALAGVWIADGRIDEAQALLAEGLSLHPHHAAMAMTLARLHAEHGELQRAAEVLEGVPATGASAEDRAFRAAILQRLNRHAEAAEQFAAALRVVPGNGVWWMGLGMSLAAEGRKDVAREAFNRARTSGTLSPELGQYVEQRIRAL